MKTSCAALAAILLSIAMPAMAADYPAPKQGDWIARDFKVHTGETMQELKLHYTTVGEPSGQPVLVLHGTGGSGASMLSPAFAGELFGAGQPLDASKYYIIIPDAIGHGKSSKPSDGMKTSFPEIQLRRHGRGAASPREGRPRRQTSAARDRQFDGRHANLAVGREISAGDGRAGADGLAADRDGLAQLDDAGIMLDTIRSDPDYNGGNYTSQPRTMKYAITAYGIASIGGTLAYQQQAPTAAKADKIVDERLATPITADANDFLYQWGSSQDYNAGDKLEQIEATLLLINSADDERNPPETGITDAAMKRVKNGKLYLIPASTETRGHGTTGNAKFYVEQVRQLLQTAPQRTM